MENIYSVTVKNKFALTDDDEDKDPFEILKRQEQEKEAKRKEKLSEKSKHQQEQQQQPKPQGQQQQTNKKNSRLNKENQGQQQPQQAQQQQQPHQQPGRGQEQHPKKDQGDKKPNQQRTVNERNVKFAENREEHNNQRNREEGERPPRIQNENRRGGPPSGDYPYQGTREFRNSNIGSSGLDGERRGRGGPRGGFRGGPRGNYRGGRGGFDNRGKREYDRQSGSDKTYGYSGIKPIDKKDGAGNHNWGTHNDEIEEGLNQTEDWGGDKMEADPSANVANESKDSSGSANVSGGEAPATGDAAPTTEEKTAEEEARELTLDEWKALRQTNRAKPTYNLRKAGEGEDLSRWKKMYALERKKEGAEEDDEDEEEYDAAEYPQRAGRQKHVFDIEINFNDSRRSGGRGGRGGRGGNRMNGRGFGNRGPPREGGGEYRSQEQRSPRERQNAPKVDDEHDFPSLG